MFERPHFFEHGPRHHHGPHGRHFHQQGPPSFGASTHEHPAAWNHRHHYGPDGYFRSFDHRGPPPHMRGSRFGGHPDGFHHGPPGPPPPPPPFQRDGPSGFGARDFDGPGFGPRHGHFGRHGGRHCRHGPRHEAGAFGSGPRGPPPFAFGRGGPRGPPPPPPHMRGGFYFHGPPPPPPPPFEYEDLPSDFESESEFSEDTDDSEKEAAFAFESAPRCESATRDHGFHHFGAPKMFDTFHGERFHGKFGRHHHHRHHGMRAAEFGAFDGPRGRFGHFGHGHGHGHRHGRHMREFFGERPTSEIEARSIVTQTQVQFQVVKRSAESKRDYKNYAVTYESKEEDILLTISSEADMFKKVYRFRAAGLKMDAVTWSVSGGMLIVIIPKVAPTTESEPDVSEEGEDNEVSKKVHKRSKHSEKNPAAESSDVPPRPSSTETWSSISTPSASDDDDSTVTATAATTVPAAQVHEIKAAKNKKHKRHHEKRDRSEANEKTTADDDVLSDSE